MNDSVVEPQLPAHMESLNWAFHTLPVGIVMLDADARYEHVNPEARRLLRLSWPTARGMPVWQDIPDFIERLVARAGRSGATHPPLCEAGHWPARDTWLRASVQATADGLCLLLVDVTDRALADRRAASLLELSTALSRTTRRDEVIQVVVEEALRTLEGAAGSVLLLNETHDALRLVGHVGFEQEPVGPWSTVPLDVNIPATDALRLRRPIFVQDFEDFQRRYPQASRDVQSAYVARAALPLVADRQTFGVLALSFTRSRSFDDAERAFLVALAGQCAQALARADIFSRSRDELERRVAERTAQLEQLSIELRHKVRSLEERTEEARRLTEANDLLQSCNTTREGYQVLAQQMFDLFRDRTGAVYEFGPSRNILEMQVSWGEEQMVTPVFSPDECWGLRRGRTFVTGGSPLELHCTHASADGRATLCIPLLAQGETVGLLHLSGQDSMPFSEHDIRVAQSLADITATALMNLRLREFLRQQSIRDALTGLFNRRYLEETLERELRRAQRLGQEVGVIMLDVDRFKHFNDTYGHEAGDVLLRSLGQALQSRIRAEDVACRYGGEEFALVLPGADVTQTLARAESIRVMLRTLDITHQSRRLGPVSASFGVASFPVHGATMSEVLRAADKALYSAKQGGRNRVEQAS